VHKEMFRHISYSLKKKYPKEISDSRGTVKVGVVLASRVIHMVRCNTVGGGRGARWRVCGWLPWWLRR